MRDERRREQLESDTETLRVLDSIPSFAPFLLKDRLTRAAITVNYRYHDLPAAEWQRTYAYVQQRFRKILSAVMPGDEAENSPTLDKLLSRLWGLNDPVALDLLATAFGLPPERSAELFYNWKGVIFFAYQYARAREKITQFLAWLSEIVAKPALLPEPRDMEARARVTALNTQAERILRNITDQLDTYEAAFEALFVTGTGAEAFRNFLLNSEKYFQSVGIDLGCLNHAAEIWDNTTYRFVRRKVDADALREIMKVLEDILFTIDMGISPAARTD